MKSNFYVVFDKKAEVYNTPVVIISDAVAIRQIKAILRDSSSVFAQFPADFSLVKIAEFDPSSGEILPLSEVILSTFEGLQEENKGSLVDR